MNEFIRFSSFFCNELLFISVLAEYEVVRAEELAEGASAHGVHGARLEVHQDGAGHVAAAGGLAVVHTS